LETEQSLGLNLIVAATATAAAIVHGLVSDRCTLLLGGILLIDLQWTALVVLDGSLISRRREETTQCPSAGRRRVNLFQRSLC
jgi:hypothetical protein